MTDDPDLKAQLRRLEPPPGMSGPDVTLLAATARRRRDGRRLAVFTGVAAVAATIAVVLLPKGADDRNEITVRPPTPTPAAASDPRSIDGLVPLACGGAGPLSAMSAAPGAERANTPEAAELRRLITQTIAGGMYRPPKTNWVVVGRTHDTVTFGHREGTVGIGDTIVVKRAGAGYTFATSGGCGSIGYSNGRAAELVYGYRSVGTELTLMWTGGWCGPGAEPRPSVKVLETKTTIQVLLVQALAPPVPPGTFCAGISRNVTTTVSLRAPVGDRKVINIGYIPDLPVIKAPR